MTASVKRVLMSLRSAAKYALLTVGKHTGAFDTAMCSRWRQRRLLILCYHGVSLRDEHEWHPRLYVTPEQLERRIKTLKRGGYEVLPLGAAVRSLYEGELPDRSVAITFDDGDYDFYKQAYPLLAAYDVPVTVYLTSYYCRRGLPVFGQVCSYMLWQKRGKMACFPDALGSRRPMDLRTPAASYAAWKEIVDYAERESLPAEQKDELAQRLAERLGIDYAELRASRVLQIMNPAEVAEMAAAGVDIELHTHRHRAPCTREPFVREIEDNSVHIRSMTGREPEHFCYPNGAVEAKHLLWLRELGITSATTCQPGIAGPDDDALLLPRFQDSSLVSDLTFEGWSTGFVPFAAAPLRNGSRGAR